MIDAQQAGGVCFFIEHQPAVCMAASSDKQRKDLKVSHQQGDLLPNPSLDEYNRCS